MLLCTDPESLLPANPIVSYAACTCTCTDHLLEGVADYSVFFVLCTCTVLC